jgi:hypothetical protein
MSCRNQHPPLGHTGLLDKSMTKRDFRLGRILFSNKRPVVIEGTQVRKRFKVFLYIAASLKMTNRR